MFKKTALEAVFKRWQKGSFAVRFWDGETVQYGSGAPVFTVIFNREPEITGIKKDLILMMGEAYMHAEENARRFWVLREERFGS